MWVPTAEQAAIANTIANWGVLLFGLLVFWSGNAVQRYSDAEVSRANNSAEQARLQASEANAEAAKANVRAAEIAQETEILRANLAEQQERAAKAELMLEEVRKKQEPRGFWIADSQRALEPTKNLPKGKLAILFQPGDEEARQLAMRLFPALAGGWKELSPPKPIPEDMLFENLRNAPPLLLKVYPFTPFARSGSKSNRGIALIAKDGSDNLIARAYLEALKSIGLMAHIGESDSAMQANDLILVVGPKM